MGIKLLTEHHLEFLRLKGDCTGPPESIYVKMPHCWKSHVAAQLCITLIKDFNKEIHPQVVNIYQNLSTKNNTKWQNH